MPPLTGLPVLMPPVTAGVAARPLYADVLVAETRGDVSPGGALGSVAAASDGDLAGADTRQALRTRLTRLVTNVEDAYAHLRGWGLAPQRGQLARKSDLERIRLQAERQLRQDPDVRDARITITFAPSGARRSFLYEVEVQDRTGQVDRFLTEG